MHSLKRKNAIYKTLIFLSLFLFLVLLTWGLYFKMNRYSAVIKNYKRLNGKNLFERFTYDLLPFQHLFRRPDNIIKDFLLNVLAFVPFGFYLPLLINKRTIFKGALICFFISLCVETAQLLTIVGTFSTNDIIANTLGFFVGFALFKKIKIKSHEKAVNLINAVFIAVIIPFLIIVLSDTVTHFSVYVYKQL